MSEAEYDDMLPVSLWHSREHQRFVLLDKHNDRIAVFDNSRDDKECQRIVDAINAARPVPMSEVRCVFCGTQDFDLIGLKYHLQAGHCEVYNQTDTLPIIRHRHPPIHDRAVPVVVKEVPHE